jgi:alpha-tubulin suppressor-like RCC1 family protein
MMPSDVASVNTSNGTVAIKTDGSLWAWGYNGWGDLGDGTAHNSNVPVSIGDSNDLVTVSLRADQTIAIRSDGSIRTWGRNNWGQIGDGTTEARYVPTAVRFQ